MTESLDDMAKKANKALVLGIGGGGDVVGTIPTSRYLRELDVKTIVGGLTWERYVNDPEPGPRKISELENAKPLSNTTALANAKTQSKSGVRFTEAIIAEALGEETFLLDFNEGVQGAISGLNTAFEKLDIDLFVGIDVGGDVLARGDEEGLHSMLADSMNLAAMTKLKIPTILGVLGFGVDGELDLDTLLENTARVASKGGYLGARGLTQKDLDVLDKVIGNTKTEATALAARAAKGEMGKTKIREGYREVYLTPISALTFFLDPLIVLEEISIVGEKLVSTKSLDEAQEILKENGVPSELTFERNYVWKDYVEKDKLSDGGS
ncbi:hypothetical protein AKJ42_00770 [candidate division MSBL1 archaeon SCGC-AAA261C02]|uniref:DUF1152 domain-containing protein n=1 Tax=candidate division MSBL1 archaeon SCGC-AAA261C02 TaxID=1698272 RepID=A0A133V1X8_9EURY|nr:hypothetical protein AKJ42_00770 [candidate division MSBL1 archaeon SCGC-AAA261C02]